MSRGRIARWMLEETGQPYRAEIVEFGPAMKTSAYLAINPMGKVPSLSHRGVVVTEVAAILAYLADAFPQAGLAPALDDPARGTYHRWMFFAAGPFEYAVVNRSFGFEVSPDGRGRVGYGSYENVMDTLDRVLSGTKFIAGSRFSAADLYLSATLGWGMRMGSIEPRESFEIYSRRHLARPAAAKAGAADDALLRSKPS
jgi:glutathione S-transferase